MKKPTGKELLAKLVELYADQEGVKINYKIEGKEKESGKIQTDCG